MRPCALFALGLGFCLAVGGLAPRAAAAEEAPLFKGRPARDWLFVLKQGNYRTRWLAVDALCHFGPRASSTGPALLKLLKDKDADQRGAAAVALAYVFPAGEAIVPALTDALAGGTEPGKERAAKALERLGPGARAEAARLLVGRLRDPEHSPSLNAGLALAKLGKEGLVPLRAALKHRSEGVRSRAAFCLGQMRAEAREAVPDLAGRLKDGNLEVRVEAALALRRVGDGKVDVLPTVLEGLRGRGYIRLATAHGLRELGPEAEKAIPTLRALLADKDRYARSAALHGLIVVGPPSIPMLVKALEPGPAVVRTGALGALAGMGPKARPALGAVRAVLNDPDQGVKVGAGWALYKIEGKAEPAVRALTEQLKDANMFRRHNAAGFLGRMGPDGAAAIPALRAALRDKKAGVSSSAVCDALSRMGPAAVPVLIEALGDVKNEQRQIDAQSALRQMGKPAVPALSALLKDPKTSRPLRARTTYILENSGPDAFPALIEALKSPDSILRSAAARGLGKWDVLASAAVPALVAALGDPDENVRLASAEALARIGPGPEAVPALARALQASLMCRAAGRALARVGPPAVPALGKALAAPAPQARREAARALGEIGPEAADALPALRQASLGPDELAAFAAREAMRRILGKEK
jgi:HEAT repeat protein